MHKADRPKDCDPTPTPPPPRPLHAAWDDLDFGVCLLLGGACFVALCVGLAAGVMVTLAVVR